MPGAKNPHGLIHRHERHKPDKNKQPQQGIPFWIEHHKVHVVVERLAHERLGDQMQEGVTEEAADSEGDHDGEGGRIDVGRAEGEEEVYFMLEIEFQGVVELVRRTRRSRDVRRREQTIHRRPSRKQHRKNFAHDT